MFDILKVVFLPPGAFFLIMAGGFLAQYKWPSARWLVVGAASALYLASLPLISGALLSSLQSSPALSVNRPNVEGVQAIVVLSAGERLANEYKAPAPDSLSLERVRYGAFLHHRTGLPILVSGGGPELRHAHLADILAASLENDFNTQVRWKENQSGDTWENAVYSARILRQAGMSKVLLVTHAWHMPRARLAFERQGLSVVPAPTVFVRNPLASIDSLDELISSLAPSSKALQESTYFVHEVFGLAVYSIK